jgi:Mg2+ and Co2+ transporter CorA
MSRSLEKSASELERKAENKAAVIRRVIQKYNESKRSESLPGSAMQSKQERKIEQIIAEYTDIHKALKRIRKKMRVAK